VRVLRLVEGGLSYWVKERLDVSTGLGERRSEKATKKRVDRAQLFPSHPQLPYRRDKTYVTLKPVENRRVLLEVLRIDVLARNPSSVGQIVFERAFSGSVNR
jgi:hypothetical protein